MTSTNTSHKLHNTIYACLDAIASAEKITKKELGAFSRHALTYVVDTDDIDVVNRLLGVLTPMNRLSAIAFFGHFLPWEKEMDTNDVFQKFGKRMTKAKQFAKRIDLIEEFLRDTNNNIWTWAADNLDLYTLKPWASRITKAVEKALAGEEKDNGSTPAISIAEVVAAVMAGGVSVNDLLVSINPPLAKAA